jgi:hypothetical protein
MTMIDTGQAPDQAPPMTFVAQVVRLVNEGDATFTMKYGPRDRLTLAPGQSVFVPEEVGWHFLGRWWTNNADPRNRARQAEIDRLRTLYGAYEDEVLWQANKPRLVAYDPQGQRIVSVVDDPDGDNGAPQTAFGREQNLEAQIAMMQQNILALQAQVNAKARADAEVLNDVPPPTPTPPAPPFNPSPARTQTVGNAVQVPVAPASVPGGPDFSALLPTGSEPVPQVGDAPIGQELPVHATVAYEPPVPEGDVPTDDPKKVPTGGRIPAG